EAALTGLVERQGAMVVGVCRRILRHAHDAEDAFQATFLVLARRAASIRRRSSVGGWLYQVAYHLALKAKLSAGKRRGHELREVVMPSPEPTADLSWQAVRRLCDDELQRLPADRRSAVVLCWLEGKTQDEAAQQLGWSKGTLRRRLGQGRELLRQRLVRRGLAPSAALTATLLGQPGTQAA